MGIENLEQLFHPTSVAVIGASAKPTSIGNVVTRNLLEGGFTGAVFPVNPRESEIAGLRAYQNISQLPCVPELAVICTPPHTVPGIIDEMGARGAKVAVVLTAGLGSAKDEQGRSYQEVMLGRAGAHRIRILGPNCVGVLSAESHLNASFAHIGILPGKIAFLAQSGALCASVLDWARANQVGFSHVVSLGDLADIDFGDMLDYLGSDANTTAILLYIESIGAGRAREFMSAARGAARNKPVIAVKAGRAAEGQRAAQSHTGALAGNDVVYDTALRRAGVLRVDEIGDLFDAAETLARTKPYCGDRMAILTNGGGPGVLATDALIARGGQLAELDSETIRRLDAALPGTWSRGNPVDMVGDAMGKLYEDAIKVIFDDRGVDALLILHVPTALVSTKEAATSVVEATRASRIPVFSCWLGHSNADNGRQILRDAGLPTYATPEDAVGAFMHTVQHQRNYSALLQVPASAPRDFAPQREQVQDLICDRLQHGVGMLNEMDAKSVLAAYGVPIVETEVADGTDQALETAERMGYPVALKIVSPQITHKSDVGGVVLNIDSEDELRGAIQGIQNRVAKRRPEATIEGFAVQKMIDRPRAHELILGAAVDPIFGPIILFGRGGTAVEVIGDRSVALPPLNMHLAGDLISRTRVSRLLKGYRDRPAADLTTISVTLLKISQLIIDHPQIIELDINPLLADEHGVIALDARIRIAKAVEGGRLAIRPYPRELEEMISLRDGETVLARPIRPEDHAAHERFIASLSPEDIHSRFFSTIRRLDPSQMARLTQIDYDREMAFIAVSNGGSGAQTLGVVRAIADPDNIRAEFAIVVRSEAKARGLGYALMRKIVGYCRDRGTRELVGEVLADNVSMLQMAGELGFETETDAASRTVRLRLRLRP